MDKLYLLVATVVRRVLKIKIENEVLSVILLLK